MAGNELTLGEYIRRLRREANRSLHDVATRTGISYSHLSRIENDSTVPSAESVARLAEALGGDLKLMLEKADCLPRFILDRIVAREEAPHTVRLKRAALDTTAGTASADVIEDVLVLGLAAGLTTEDARELADTVQHILKLSPTTRRAIAQFLRSLGEDAGEVDGPSG